MQATAKLTALCLKRLALARRSTSRASSAEYLQAHLPNASWIARLAMSQFVSGL
jgi:hypothetical protein